jgi:hypothetical protein
MEVFCHFIGGGFKRGNCYSYLPLEIVTDGSKLLVKLH